MAFKKRQPKQQQRKQSEPDGKISLWSPKRESKYVISGTIVIGDEKYRVFIYENDDPLYENSPEYYGSIYAQEEEEEQPHRKSKYVEKTTKVKSRPEPDEEEDDDDEEEKEDLNLPWYFPIHLN